MTASLILYRQQLIDKKKDQHLADRQALLMKPEVVQNLKASDLEIAQAGVELPVRKYKDQDLVQKIGTMVKFLCMDFGIINQDQQSMSYVAARFLKIVKSHYSDLSLKEIKMAFELAAVGELDQWLPKDKNGKPDAKSYGSFSVEFYTKILKAFRAKKGRVWHNAKKALPVLDYVISQKEREENHKATIQEIIDAFELYKSDNVKPRFQISLFINVLVEAKLIKEVRKPLKSIKEKVYRGLIMKHKGDSRRKIINDYYGGIINPTLENEAQVYQNNYDIENLFKKLVSEGKHLKDLL